MGREIRRVDVAKQCPVGVTWEGFLNPHYKKCPQEGLTCWGGENAAAVYLSHLANLFGVVADSANKGQTHPYLLDLPYGSAHPDWAKQPEDVRRSTVDFYKALIADEHDPFMGFTGTGHKVYFRLLELAGIRTNPEGTDAERGYEWGHCTVCNGEGIDPAVREAYEAWEHTEPPEGDGWQVWETVSEGSPVTPAFATADELVDYLVKYGDAWDQKRGDGGWNRENAESFVARGYAMSLIMVNTPGQQPEVYSPRDGVPA